MRLMGVAVSNDDQASQVVNVFAAATAKAEDFLGANHFNNSSNTPHSYSPPDQSRWQNSSLSLAWGRA
jgi:hypothetical protein